MTRHILLVAALIAVGVPAIPAAAQSDAIVQGQVIAATDRSPLPGATVTLQTAAGRLPKEATTDANGRFVFAQVAPDQYVVSVCVDGFEPCHIVVTIEPREVRMLSLPLARILKAHGIPPVPERPTSWQTFLKAHWGAIAGADFFTTEVWTWRGLVTYYTAFVIDLASRRVQIIGSTPHPHDVFMQHAVRTLTADDDGSLVPHRVLICDRDTKWSAPICVRLEEAGIRVVETPYRAPNANAYAERVVRSINEECLNRLIPIGERHFQRAISEYVAHYHRERNHQGIANELIAGAPATSTAGPIRRRPRLGGLLNYYDRAA